MMDIGAVDDGIRIAEAGTKGLADRHVRDLAAVDRVEQHQASVYTARARARSPIPRASKAEKAF
jgi:hypothetical protein